MIVDLVRHAATGRAGHFDGRTDSPLLADALAPVCARHRGLAWSAVVSSPRQRARLTAEALAAGSGLPVELQAAWAEWDFGDWEGRHRDDIAADGAQALQDFHRDQARHPPPNAEPWQDFEARIRQALHVLARCAATQPILVVSHAGPLRLALSLACGLPLPALWALRVDYGTRLRVRVEVDGEDRLWGELIEVRQA